MFYISSNKSRSCSFCLQIISQIPAITIIYKDIYKTASLHEVKILHFYFQSAYLTILLFVSCGNTVDAVFLLSHELDVVLFRQQSELRKAFLACREPVSFWKGISG